MEYADALAYLYERLPVFHRIGPKALKPGLENTERLCAALGSPQHGFRSIHVGGTNGKGSTAHMLAAVYQAAGYRVGLYTSPHLTDFRERIRINGRPIPADEVAAFVRAQRALIETVSPSFFEVTVALAFAYFAGAGVDLAVIEVGLGGRLDSTNVILPRLSVITNIGWDHMDVLGDTLPQIATEKAGIIKPGIPVVIGETQPETKPVFVRRAVAQGAPIWFADQTYRAQPTGLRRGRREVRVQPLQPNLPAFTQPFALDLLGTYQLRNLQTALVAVNRLQADFPVPDAALYAGLGNVVGLTGLRGRFQPVATEPTVIADTAHNLPGVRALLESVDTLTYRRLHLVLGFVADKNVVDVLTLFPESAAYYFCQAQTPRALPSAALAQQAAGLGRVGAAYANVNQALAAALSAADPADLVLVTGSTYVVAELAHLA